MDNIASYSHEPKFVYSTLSTIKKLFIHTEDECNMINSFLSGLWIDDSGISVTSDSTFEQVDIDHYEDKIYNEAEIIKIIKEYISAIESNIIVMKDYLKDIEQPIDNKPIV